MPTERRAPSAGSFVFAQSCGNLPASVSLPLLWPRLRPLRVDFLRQQTAGRRRPVDDQAYDRLEQEQEEWDMARERDEQERDYPPEDKTP